MLQLAFAAVAFVPQPRPLGTPVELFGLPDIGATAAETERLEAHRLQRDVAGENHKIGPGDFPAVFLLDRPQQPARLVEVRVVRPAVEGREALLAGAGAAAAVGDAVCARGVPRHADQEWPVMAKVGRPPILRLRHQGMQVLDHGIEVEGLEFLGVVERLAHRIGQGGVLVENLNVQLVRPPVTVRPGRMHDRALARALVGLRVHGSLRACPPLFSRSVYKDHLLLESDPSSWPGARAAQAECLVTGQRKSPSCIGIDVPNGSPGPSHRFETPLFGRFLVMQA